MGGARLLAVRLIALVLVARGAAHAEPPVPARSATSSQDPGAARRALAAATQLAARADALEARGRLDEARSQRERAVASFERALEAGAGAPAYLALAGAEEKLGRPAPALRHLRAALAGGEGGASVAARASAQLEALLARVGLVSLVVNPPGASVTLGGVALGTAPLAEPLVLRPGTYTLTFQAAGFQPHEAEVVVQPGAELERSVALEPVRVVVTPIAELPPPVATTPSQAPLYVGLGVTAAAAACAGVFGALALREHRRFTRDTASAAEREDARSSGRRFALAADVSLVTGLAAAGVTAYWYLSRRASHGDRAAASTISTKLSLVPWVQPPSGGLVVAGGF